ADRSPDDPMIEQAWNEYRGWAKRARSLQAKTGRWNFWALVAVIVAALAGAAASYSGVDATGAASSEAISRALACAAMVASVSRSISPARFWRSAPNPDGFASA